MSFSPVYLHAKNSVSSLGIDLSSNWNALVRGKSGIALQAVGKLGACYVAKLGEDLREQLISPSLPSSLLERMLYTAAQPVLEQHRITARTGLILSSTKGNIGYLAEGRESEAGLSVLAARLAAAWGIQTEPLVVSQACVSGLLAVSVAKRLIQMGQFDDAIVLAADVVGEFVTAGFQSFQAMSPFPCKPYDKSRAGVSLGEAAACVFLSKEQGAFRIAGEGSINDANHISGPSRTGIGLVKSVLSAMQEAAIRPEHIDFISAHGTATLYNDEMEAIAFNCLGMQDRPLYSLKGYYGHTLGAAGLLELVLGLKALEENTLLPTLGFETYGVSQPLQLVDRLMQRPLRCFLKTASGFGGSNAAMLIEKL